MEMTSVNEYIAPIDVVGNTHAVLPVISVRHCLGLCHQ